MSFRDEPPLESSEPYPYERIAREFYHEVFDRRNVNALEDLCTPGFTDSGPELGEQRDLAMLKTSIDWLRRSAPDFRFFITQVVVAFDMAVVRVTGTGNVSFWPLSRPVPIPAHQALHIVRFEGPKISELRRFTEEPSHTLFGSPSIGQTIGGILGGMSAPPGPAWVPPIPSATPTQVVPTDAPATTQESGTVFG